MIKPSKYLLAFAGLFILLGTSVTLTSQKFLPLLLRHTVYYCQSILHSFSTRIPSGIGIFLAGALALAVGFALTNLLTVYLEIVHSRKKFQSQMQKNSIFSRLVNKLNLQGKAFLVPSKKPFAICYGVRYPKIYVSQTLFAIVNPKELEAILRHEKYHLDQKDSFTLLLAETARSLFPFFPLLSDLIQNFRIERELAADQAAVISMGSPKALISVLKKLLTVEPAERYALASALADHKTLEIRIKALTINYHRFSRFGLFNIGLSILSLGIFAVLVVAPVQAIELHDTQQDAMMVCAPGNECVRWCKENATVTPLMTKIPNASTP